MLIYLGMLLTASPVNAQSRVVPRLGLLWLGSTETSSLRDALLSGLRARGLVEGKSLLIEDRTSVARYEQLDEAAAHLVQTKPDVVVTYGATATSAARKATSTIPIVMITGGDPVQYGFVKSLSHPGGNITGLTMMGDELSAKRLAILKAIAPRISKVGIMFNPASPVEAESLKSAQDGARTLGLETYAAEVRIPEDIEMAFARMELAKVDSLLVVGSTMLFAYRRQICDLAKRYRLPTVANTREFSDEGALLAFGPDVAYTFQQASVYVARILKGESPAALPFEQSSKLRLAVNLTTARALNIAIPQSILVRADDMVQ